MKKKREKNISYCDMTDPEIFEQVPLLLSKCIITTTAYREPIAYESNSPDGGVGSIPALKKYTVQITSKVILKSLKIHSIFN